MISSLEPVVVTLKQRMPATDEAVFDAWVTPGLAKKFFFTTPGSEILVYEMTAVTAGGFTITERRPNPDGRPGTLDVKHVGHYIDIARPSRLCSASACRSSRARKLSSRWILCRFRPANAT